MSRKIKQVLLLLLMLGLMPGCSLLSSRMMATNELELLPVLPEMATDGPLQQKITLIHDGKTQTFVAVQQQKAGRVDMVVLLPTGQRVLTMQYDGQQFTAKNYTDTPLPAEEVFAVMQFASWPQTVVKQHYSEPDWHTKMRTSQRQLFKQHTLVLNVQITDKQTSIEHVLHHYQVIIEPVEN